MQLTLKASVGYGSFFYKDAGVLITTAGASFDTDPGMIHHLARLGSLRALVSAGNVIVNNGTTDLSITDGLRYLVQLWLMSGNDTSPQFTHIEGTITDFQHGSRGGGTLHPAATPTTSGFFSSTDKTKLDGIGGGALPRCSYTFGDQGTAGLTKSGAGYAARRYFRWPGTNAIGRTTGFICKIIAYRSSGNSGCSVRIYDETNGVTIAEQTGITAATRTIYSPTVTGTLSTGEAIYRIDLDGGSGSTVVLEALELY